MADPTIPTGTPIVQGATSNTTTVTNQPSIVVNTPTEPGAGSAPSLQLPATTIIPGLAKDIKVGDVINFVMRGRSPDGLGLLYMMGQLVKANVPEHLGVGDKVQAKIERLGQKLLFKIVEVQAKNNDAPIMQNEQIFQQLRVSVPEKLERQIFELLTKLAPFLPDQALHTHAPIKELTSSIQSLQNQAPPEVKLILQELQKMFVSEKALTNGQNIFNFIKEAFSPQNLAKIKDILIKLETVIQKETGSPEIRFFAKTLESLRDISLLSDDKNPVIVEKVRKDLEKLLKVLILESETESVGKTQKKNYIYFDSVKRIASDLSKILQDNEPITKSVLDKLMNTISQLQPEAKSFSTKSSFAPEGLRELIQLTTNLEQFANTISMLNQLEPLMGLMQAPELILFPFIFQGLLSFSEFAIDPNAHKQKQSQKQSKDNEEEGSEKNKTIDKMYRYTTSIQLPNLGMVHISSLQEDRKIDIQINVDDSEKGAFIMSQMPDLKNELMSHGIVLGEMSADAIDISNEIVIES